MVMTPHKPLTGFMTWFLYAFLADGVLSLISEALTVADVPVPFLAGLRGFVSVIVVLWAGLAFVLLFVTPRLSKRIYLPAVLFAYWASFGSYFPLSLWNSPYAIVIVAALQIIVGIISILALRKTTRPLLDESRPAFAWGNLAAGLAISVGMVIFTVTSIAFLAADAIDTHTGGYATLRPSGFYLEERTFRKDDKEVRLIGMVHIARAGFYDSVASDLRGIKSAVVLLEGVSDEKGLLKNRLSYAGFARFIGATAQEKSTFTSQAMDSMRAENTRRSPIEYMHADLDISALQPHTLTLVESLSRLLASETITEALIQLQDKDSPFNDEAGVKLAFVDLIQTRNQHLLETLQVALTRSNLIIVPWGAMHLQDLQKELEKMGFQQVSHKARQALAFFPS